MFYPPGARTPSSFLVEDGGDSSLPARSPHRWELVADTVLGFGMPGVDGVVHARVFEAPAPAEETAAPPVVLLTQFGDHQGRAITLPDAVVDAAAAAQHRFYPHGRMLRLVVGITDARSFPVSASESPLVVREVLFRSRSRHGVLRRWWTRRRVQREQRRGRSGFALTELTPQGVTQHVLASAAASEDPWTFRGPSFGRDLRVEVPEQHRSALSGWDAIGPWARPGAVRVPAVLGETEVATWPTEQYTANEVLGQDAGAYAAVRLAEVRARQRAEEGLIEAYASTDPDRFVADMGSVNVRPEHRRR